MESLNQQILDYIRDNASFAVATILTHKGSTPRTSGSKMLVLKDKTIHGTIGGGLVEALIINACIELIEQKKCAVREFTLDKKLKSGLDMICGGAISVLIETFISASESEPDSNFNKNIFKTLIDLEEKGRKGFLVSKIQGFNKSGFNKSGFTMQKSLVLSDGTIVGNNIVPKPLFDNLLNNKFNGSAPIVHNESLEEYIVEPIMPKDCIYIFGAGHVGFQLAKIAHITDFQTIIVDDRKEFANKIRFPYAKQIHVPDHFSRAFDNLEIDQNSYIVILTRGHLHDQTVLESALRTAPAYIGMIGSITKRNKIYKNLEKKGVANTALKNINSPVGIEIKAQTPGEIAVSIIGEIIKKRYSTGCYATGNLNKFSIP